MTEKIEKIITIDNITHYGFLINETDEKTVLEFHNKKEELDKKQIVSRDSVLICTDCNNIVSEYDNYCSNCGIKLKEKIELIKKFNFIDNNHIEIKQYNDLNNLSQYEEFFYIPELFLTKILNDDNPVDKPQKTKGTVLFADISGFTKLSEKLIEVGKEGTEQLTKTLNQYFTSMLRIIDSYGGEVIKFSGDAITILFVSDDSVLLSIVCAIDMQEAMREFSDIRFSFGSFGLRMKIGIEFDEVNLIIAGNDKRSDFLLYGVAIDKAIFAENLSNPGEIIIGSNANAIAKDYISVYDEREEYYIVSSFDKTKYNIKKIGKDKDYSKYLPIKNKIKQFLPRTDISTGEHRKATSIFLNFEYDINIQKVFDTIVDIVFGYDGFINKIDIGDDGIVILILFGADIMHDNDKERATKCILDIKNKLTDIKIRAGINSGFVFCGNIGSVTRKEFTAIGQSQNIAARLMALASEGEVLITDRYKNNIENLFFIEKKGNFILKGIKNQVEVYNIIKERPRGDIFSKIVLFKDKLLIGRDNELKIVDEIITKVNNNEGQIVGIKGEAGSGKSHFFSKVLERFLEEDFFGIAGECVSHGKLIAFLPIIDILNKIFGIVNDSVEFKKDKIIKYCNEMIADKKDFFFLLFQYMGISNDSNDIIDKMNAKNKIENIQVMIIDIIKNISKQKKLVIIIEDFQWIDKESLKIIEMISAISGELAICLILIYRPEKELESFMFTSNYTEIVIENLNNNEAVKLIDNVVEKNGFLYNNFDEESINKVIDISEGNPLYIEEYIDYLLKTGNLFVNDKTNKLEINLKTNLPDTLSTAIINRIDNLETDEKDIIKYASVIGRTFSLYELKGIYQNIIDENKLIIPLMNLNSNNLISILDYENLEYSFKHDYIQKSIYDNMSFFQKKEIHTKFAYFIEEKYKNNLSKYYSKLAYHFENSDNIDKYLEYCEKAGDEAKNIGQGTIAIEFYKKIINNDIRPADNKKVTIKLCESYQMNGNFNDLLDITEKLLADGRDNIELLTFKSIATVALGKKDDAMILAEHLFEKLNNIKDKNSLVKFAFQIGFIWKSVDNTSKSKEILEKYEQFVYEIDENQQYEYLLMLQDLYWHYSDGKNFLRLLKYFENISEEKLTIKNRIQLYSNLANAYKNEWITIKIEKEELVVRYTKMASDIAKKYGYLYSYNEMNGYQYFQDGYVKKDFKESIAVLKKSIEYFALINEVPKRSRLTEYLGKSYFYNDQFDLAIKTLKELISFSESKIDKTSLASYNYLLHYIYCFIGENEEQKKYLKDAILYQESVNDIYADFNKIRFYALQEDYEKSIEYSENVLEKLHNMDFVYTICSFVIIFSRIYSGKYETNLIEKSIENQKKRLKDLNEDWQKYFLIKELTRLAVIYPIQGIEEILKDFEYYTELLFFDNFSRFILPKFYKGLLLQRIDDLLVVKKYFSDNNIKKRADKIDYFIDCIKKGTKIIINQFDFIFEKY